MRMPRRERNAPRRHRGSRDRRADRRGALVSTHRTEQLGRPPRRRRRRRRRDRRRRRGPHRRGSGSPTSRSGIAVCRRRDRGLGRARLAARRPARAPTRSASRGPRVAHRGRRRRRLGSRAARRAGSRTRGRRRPAAAAAACAGSSSARARSPRRSPASASSSADGVELVPDASGVRVITGAARVRGGDRRRCAVELDVRAQRRRADAAPRAVRPRARGRRHRHAHVAGEPRGRAARRRGRPPRRSRRLARGCARRSTTAASRAARGRARAPARLRASPCAAIAIPLARARARSRRTALVLDTARATGELGRARAHGAIQLDGRRLGRRPRRSITRRSPPQPVPVARQRRAARSRSRPTRSRSTRLALDIGAIHWTRSGWLRRGTPASGQLDRRSRTAPCADLLASLPAELRGPLDGMVLTARSAAARTSRSISRRPIGDGVDARRRARRRLPVAAEPPAADVTSLAGATEHVVRRRLARQASARRADLVRAAPPARAGARRVRLRRGRPVLRPPRLRPARRSRAASRSICAIAGSRAAARRSASSSIKNAFLTQRRTLDRKVQEAVLTWRLEARLDKQHDPRALPEHHRARPARVRHRAPPRSTGSTSRRASSRPAGRVPRRAHVASPTSMARRVRRAGGLDPDSAERVDVILRAMRRDGVIDEDELDARRTSGSRSAGKRSRPPRARIVRSSYAITGSTRAPRAPR